MNDRTNNIILLNGLALILNLIIFLFINVGIFVSIITNNFGIEFKFCLLGFLIIVVESFLNVKAIKQADLIKKEGKHEYK